MSDNGEMPGGMWNYCEDCGVQWHSLIASCVCDICNSSSVLHSKYNKIGVSDE